MIASAGLPDISVPPATYLLMRGGMVGLHQ